MNRYQVNKEEVRELAKFYQKELAHDGTTDYITLAEIGLKLKKLAKRYGLIKEFRREGIL